MERLHAEKERVLNNKIIQNKMDETQKEVRKRKECSFPLEVNLDPKPNTSRINVYWCSDIAAVLPIRINISRKKKRKI